MSYQTDLPERVAASDRADDQPVRVVHHIPRSRYQTLIRRALVRRSPVETEGSRLLSWALLEVVERAQRPARMFTQAEVDRIAQNERRRARREIQREMASRSAGAS